MKNKAIQINELMHYSYHVKRFGQLLTFGSKRGQSYILQSGKRDLSILKQTKQTKTRASFSRNCIGPVKIRYCINIAQHIVYVAVLKNVWWGWICLGCTSIFIYMYIHVYILYKEVIPQTPRRTLLGRTFV